MEDLMYIAIVVVFFALMLALVYACDRIIGSDEEALGSTPVARRRRRGRRGGRLMLAFLDAKDFVGLVLGVALIVYLLFALLFPEKL